MKRTISIFILLAICSFSVLVSCGNKSGANENDIDKVVKEYVEDSREAKRSFADQITSLSGKTVSSISVSFGSYDRTLDNNVYRGQCKGKVTAYDEYGDLIATYRFILNVTVPKNNPQTLMGIWYGPNGMALIKE